MFQYLLFFGAALQLLGSLHYAKETLSARTKPNRVTWFMWSLAPLIATAAALANGVQWAVLPVFMAGFGPLLVFLSSFINKKSFWKLEKFDYLCGFFSILALILWYLTNEPNIAILFAIISDGFAAIPSLIKSWKHPETETVSPYLATIFASLTSFLIIKKWSFSEYAFPVYLIIVCTTFVVFIWRNKFRQTKQ